MAGHAQISYLVAAFPEGTSFVRIQSSMRGFVNGPTDWTPKHADDNIAVPFS